MKVTRREFIAESLQGILSPVVSLLNRVRLAPDKTPALSSWVLVGRIGDLVPGNNFDLIAHGVRIECYERGFVARSLLNENYFPMEVKNSNELWVNLQRPSLESAYLCFATLEMKKEE